MTFLCVSIFIDSVVQARRDIALAAEAGAQMVELRIDRFTDAELVQGIVKSITLPAIVTCRSPAEGGACALSDSDRLALLDRVAEVKPAYVDLELASSSPASFAAAPRDQRPGLILSSHDFAGRPDRLYGIIGQLNQSRADINKIVWMARTIRDNIEAFEILQNRHKPTIALCMGEAGMISRILAKKFGAFLTFASLGRDSATASGQVSIADLKNLYRWDAIGPQTAVYGVVGSPIAHSMSPAIHNAAFDHTGHDGVYLPLLVNESYESFKAFMETFLACAPLNLRGLSVTIPHKENALRYLEEAGGVIEPLARRIGAVNTIAIASRRHEGAEARRVGELQDHQPATSRHQLSGSNSDYAAILDSVVAALEISREQLAGLPVAVIGAGGTGRTATAAFAHHGARVTIYNRTLDRATALAAEFSTSTVPVAAASLADLGRAEARIFINTTSVGMHPKADASPFDATVPALTADTVVFDCVYNPVETKLLLQARAAGARTISGLEMFVRQAATQFEAWTQKSAPRDLMRQVILGRLS